MANSVVQFGLEAYISESEDKNTMLSVPRLDDDFAATATHQIRLFLLAHTTRPQAPSFLSSTSCPNTPTLALNYEQNMIPFSVLISLKQTPS
jgi:hypothetical protein